LIRNNGKVQEEYFSVLELETKGNDIMSYKKKNVKRGRKEYTMEISIEKHDDRREKMVEIGENGEGRKLGE
jgi:hypothetical protein